MGLTLGQKLAIDLNLFKDIRKNNIFHTKVKGSAGQE